MNINKKSLSVASLAVAALAIGIMTVGFVGGCKKVTGTRVENQTPIVWFANVPPEDQRFSTNPLVHWVGQDRDGQVVQFRYRVIRQTSLMKAIGRPDTTAIPQPADIDAYAQILSSTAPDSVWIYLTVDPQAGQPQTGVIIPLVAELNDPVRTYVPQFVFVQAIDDRGAFSNIAHRRFVRNNNPPNTRILGFDSTRTPYIDALTAGGIATGIPLMRTASDILDYPTEPPPFEFQWRLYGPFDSATWVSMERQFRRVAYVTTDARVFIIDRTDLNHDTLQFCDTAWYDGVPVESCDTIVVDTVTVANLHGHLDTIFNVENPAFANDTSYNLIADSSRSGVTSWILSTRDTLYDAFRRRPSPNTQQGRFLFWIRSRDDARGPDVAPAFISFSVVSPKYENMLLVADVDRPYALNKRILSAARLYWDTTYKSWHGSSEGWNLARDYHMVPQSSGNILPLSLLLSHKMVVIVSDDVIKGVFNTPDVRKRVFTALDAGVSVWMCGRSMFIGDEDKPPKFVQPGEGDWPVDDASPATRNYHYYFGCEAYQHSGWDWFARKDPTVRIEDFVGTSSLNSALWPDLKVDTSLLRRRYLWGGDYYPFLQDTGALPEVGYMISGFGTEVMHLYKSSHGTELLPSPISKSFDGRPVMHRLNRGVYRSAVSLFTPYAMWDTDPQTGVSKTVFDLLDYLYFPFQQGAAPGTAEFYFPDGAGTVSREEARKIHFEAVE